MQKQEEEASRILSRGPPCSLLSLCEDHNLTPEPQPYPCVQIEKLQSRKAAQLQEQEEEAKFSSRKVDVRLRGKGNSTSHFARPDHLIITMMDQ